MAGGCGSGSSGSSSTGGSTSAASATTGGSSSELAQFKTKAAAALKASPTSFSGPTDPVPAPAHFKIALISCASVLEGCQSPTDSAAAAARSLGWEVRVYDGKSDPQKTNAAMLNAIAWGAQAIGNMSIDPNLVQQGLAAAKKKGVIVFSGDNGTDAPNPVVKPAAGKLGYAFDVAVDWRALGKAAADWIIADGGGKSHVVVYQDKEFPGSLAEEEGLLAELKTCGGCKITSVEQFSASEIGTTLPSDTVAYIRKHTDVTHMWAAFDPAAIGQAQALRQAGLANKVKLVSTIGATQNLELIRTGNVQVADAAYDNVYLGYASIDQLLRLLAKQPQFDPKGENVPFVVLDKTNLTPSGKAWVSPIDTAATFGKLWTKGG